MVVTGAVSISSTGFINLDKARYNHEDTIVVQVADRDLNTNNSAAEQAVISISSTAEPGGETVQLLESGPNTAIFTGTIQTRPVPAVAGNGNLEISDGDTIRATYYDADDGTGASVNRTATAVADLTAPVISGITVSAIGQDAATVSWTTNEPVATAVRYGEAPGNLGASQGDSWLVTSPVVHLPNLKEDAPWFYTVSATDEAGNTSVDDNDGRLYSFTTLNLPPALTFYSSNLTRTYQAETVLYGIAKDPSGIESVRITGGNLNQAVACRPNDGYYELRVSLAVGDNPFTVTALDTLGNAQVMHLTVTRLEQPDLLVTSVTAPASGGFFQPIHIDTTVCNNGPGASPGTGRITWYLSPDIGISPAEDTKLGLEYYHGDEIPPGDCISIQVDIRLAIPLALVWKTYYLAAFVDSGGVIWEADEANNILPADNLITIEGADLAMTELTGPAKIEPGTGFTVFNTVRNIGLGTSIPFNVAIYLSADDVITMDDIPIGSRYVNYLEPVGTPYPYPSESSRDTEVFVKDTVLAGTYRIGAIAAPGSTYQEPDKDNNVILGNLIQVGDPDAVPPTVPQDLVGSPRSYNRIYLGWQVSTDIGGSGVAGYRIYRDNLDIGSAATNAYTDAGLVAGTTYAYSVAAFDHAGNLSGQSAVVLVTTGPLPPLVNLPPTIAGSPPERAVANEIYDFTLAASDPNGDPLLFSISNKPDWMSFNAATGTLQGIPGEGHIGVHGPMAFTVRDPYGESDSLQFSIEVIPGSSARIKALQSVYLLLLEK